MIFSFKTSHIYCGYIIFASIVALSFFFFWQVRDLPIVRIGLYHAKMTSQLLDTNFNIDAINTFGKYYRGMGLALIATPFVNLFGLNLAVKFASFITSLLFLISSYLFFQHFNHRVGIPPKYVILELLILFWNPLMIHQFSSAYADSGVSLMYLLTLILFDRLQTEKGGWPSVIELAFCLLVAYYFKTIGLVFLPLILMVYCIQILLFGQSFPRGRTLIMFCATALIYGVFFYLAMNKHLGFFYLNLDNLQSRGQTLSLFSFDEHFLKFITVIEVFGLTFGVLNILFLRTLRGIQKKRSSSDRLLILSTLIISAIILMERGATYNLRLFLPIIPILCFYLTRGFLEFKKSRLMTGLLVSYFLLNTFTVVTYNIPSINRLIPLALPIIARAHDNFRIPSMVRTRNIIRKINEMVPNAGRLIILDGYYVHGKEAYGHGVYARMGLFRNDIQIEYVTPNEFKILPETGCFYLWRHPYWVPGLKMNFDSLLKRFDYEVILPNRLYRIKGYR